MLLGCTHQPAEQPRLRDTALELLLRIESNFFRDDKLYSHDITSGKPSGPAHCRAAAQQLSAMAAAARVEPFWRVRLNDYINAMDAYWIELGGIGGYSQAPHMPSPVRSHEDNAWMALALLDAFDLTQDPEHLRRAQAALAFPLAAYPDDRADNASPREPDHDADHPGTAAAATVACLRLYLITGDTNYIASAENLDALIPTGTSASDGLRRDPTTHRANKASPNRLISDTAMRIRAACLWFDITDNIQHLSRARRTAAEGVRSWIRPPATAVRGESGEAAAFAEALLELYRRDGDERWHSAAMNAVRFVAFRNPDPHGWHPAMWNFQPEAPLACVRLLDQAAAARAMLLADIVR